MTGNDDDLQKKIAELESQLAAEEAKRRTSIKDLQDQLAREKAKSQRNISFKVSEKGGVSLYGIRRFPITFYLEEWLRILDLEKEIRAFLAQNEAKLARKG